MLLDKTIEFWVALLAAVAFVINHHKEKPWVVRTTIAGGSGGVGFAVANDLSTVVPWLGEHLAAFLVSAFAYVVFDLASGLLSKPDKLIELWKIYRGENDGRD